MKGKRRRGAAPPGTWPGAQFER